MYSLLESSEWRIRRPLTTSSPCGGAIECHRYWQTSYMRDDSRENFVKNTWKQVLHFGTFRALVSKLLLQSNCGRQTTNRRNGATKEKRRIRGRMQDKSVRGRTNDEPGR